MADDTLQGDLAQLDTRAEAHKQDVEAAAAEMRSGAEADSAEAEADAKAKIARAEQHAASMQPFTQEGPQDQINKVMAGAPFLFALTALGGKASKINGMAMLEGLNGVSAGILAGNKEALDQNWKRYDAAFEKWKSNSDLQDKVFKELDDAYSSAADGTLRAHMAAHAITNDIIQMKLQVGDPATWAKVKEGMIDAHAKLMDARAKMAAANQFSGDAAALMAALAERGVSLPVGLRSKQQQQALYQGLLARNPGKSVDEIADMVKSGAISFGAEKKETQTAAAVAGRVAVAANEIKEFTPLIRKASAAVPRGQFVPINRLMQAGEASISDPNLKQLRIAVNSLLNAYDLLAARGGTDKDKRAAAHMLITAADSPEALEAGLKQFELEAEAAGRAAQAAEKGSAPNKQVNFHDLP